MVDLISMGYVTHTPKYNILCLYFVFLNNACNTLEKNTELFEHLFDHPMKSDY